MRPHSRSAVDGDVALALLGDVATQPALGLLGDALRLAASPVSATSSPTTGASATPPPRHDLTGLNADGAQASACQGALTY
ncbi:MAG: hypothetical protein LC777_10695 [Actinobacteria bacterium]|nr:hypothetical protein [Actinomycetota bacterium]